jgi:hypothetical protein
MNVRHYIISAVLMGALSLAACDGDDDGTNNPDSGVRPDSGMQAVCDPNEGPPHVQLLNAPLAQGVEVVKKTPRHPGEPGPEGLP